MVWLHSRILRLILYCIPLFLHYTYVELNSAVICFIRFYCTILCYIMLCLTLICCIGLYYLAWCFFHVVLYYSMLWYIMRWCIMLGHVQLFCNASNESWYATQHFVWSGSVRFHYTISYHNVVYSTTSTALHLHSVVFL